MLAADAWVVVGSVAAVLLLVVGIWTLALMRSTARPSRKQRAAERAAEDGKSRAHAAQLADAELVGATWRFEYRLHVAVGDAVPTRPPIELSVEGGNVWVHDVRFTWKYSQPPISPWVIKDEPCPPWDGVTLPQQLNSGGRALQLGWPGQNPPRQEQIMEKMKVTYSASRDGPRHDREAQGRSVAWQ